MDIPADYSLMATYTHTLSVRVSAVCSHPRVTRGYPQLLGHPYIFVCSQNQTTLNFRYLYDCPYRHQTMSYIWLVGQCMSTPPLDMYSQYLTFGQSGSACPCHHQTCTVNILHLASRIVHVHATTRHVQSISYIWLVGQCMSTPPLDMYGQYLTFGQSDSACPRHHQTCTVNILHLTSQIVHVHATTRHVWSISYIWLVGQCMSTPPLDMYGQYLTFGQSDSACPCHHQTCTVNILHLASRIVHVHATTRHVRSISYIWLVGQYMSTPPLDMYSQYLTFGQSGSACPRHHQTCTVNILHLASRIVHVHATTRHVRSISYIWLVGQCMSTPPLDMYGQYLTFGQSDSACPCHHQTCTVNILHLASRIVHVHATTRHVRSISYIWLVGQYMSTPPLDMYSQYLTFGQSGSACPRHHQTCTVNILHLASRIVHVHATTRHVRSISYNWLVGQCMSTPPLDMYGQYLTFGQSGSACPCHHQTCSVNILHLASRIVHAYTTTRHVRSISYIWLVGQCMSTPPLDMYGQYLTFGQSDSACPRHHQTCTVNILHLASRVVHVHATTRHVQSISYIWLVGQCMSTPPLDMYSQYLTIGQSDSACPRHHQTCTVNILHLASRVVHVHATTRHVRSISYIWLVGQCMPTPLLDMYGQYLTFGQLGSACPRHHQTCTVNVLHLASRIVHVHATTRHVRSISYIWLVGQCMSTPPLDMYGQYLTFGQSDSACPRHHQTCMVNILHLASQIVHVHATTRNVQSISYIWLVRQCMSTPPLDMYGQYLTFG